MTKVFLLAAVAASLVQGEDEHPARPLTAPQKDPRVWPYTSVRFKDGRKPAEGDPGAYVIIAWAHPPAGGKELGYQIWGDKRIVSRETLVKSVERILKERPLDLIIVGNDWGAGSELDAALGPLSGRFHVDVMGGSTFGFDNVDFHEESEKVRALVSKAITESIHEVRQEAGAPSR